MDPLENPYTPSAGRRPPAFVGRDREIDAFKLLLGRLSRGLHANSLVLYGLRGVGKTVLTLSEFERLAREHGWYTVAIEARDGIDFEQSIGRELARALRGFQQDSRAVRSAVDLARRALTSFELTYGETGGWGLGFKSEPLGGTARTGNVEDDLPDLVVAVGEAARAADSGIVVAIDEMQLLQSEPLKALVAALHRVEQRELPVALVGAGLPQLPAIIASAKTYAERLISFRLIGNLDVFAAARALQAPAEEHGARWEDDALDYVVAVTDRYPYFLQLYGQHAWNTATGPTITLADVEWVRRDVQDELDHSFFYVRWERATPKERTYMAALARLGDGPQASGETSREAGYRRVGDASVIRDQLIRKGLLYAPDHGKLDFTAPLFADYIRRRHPRTD